MNIKPLPWQTPKFTLRSLHTNRIVFGLMALGPINKWTNATAIYSPFLLRFSNCTAPDANPNLPSPVAWLQSPYLKRQPKINLPLLPGWSGIWLWSRWIFTASSLSHLKLATSQLSQLAANPAWHDFPCCILGSCLWLGLISACGSWSVNGYKLVTLRDVAESFGDAATWISLLTTRPFHTSTAPQVKPQWSPSISRLGRSV